MALSRGQIYQCGKCGNQVELLGVGGGVLTCCNQPMALLDEQTADSSLEKHVPVVEKVDGGIKVKVGSVPHPMLEQHYIVWIEAVADGETYRAYLEPGMEPEAFFPIAGEPEMLREFCNVHGLWKA